MGKYGYPHGDEQPQSSYVERVGEIDEDIIVNQLRDASATFIGLGIICFGISLLRFKKGV